MSETIHCSEKRTHINICCSEDIREQSRNYSWSCQKIATVKANIFFLIYIHIQKTEIQKLKKGLTPRIYLHSSQTNRPLSYLYIRLALIKTLEESAVEQCSFLPSAFTDIVHAKVWELCSLSLSFPVTYVEGFVTRFNRKGEEHLAPCRLALRLASNRWEMWELLFPKCLLYKSGHHFYYTIILKQYSGLFCFRKDTVSLFQCGFECHIPRDKVSFHCFFLGSKILEENFSKEERISNTPVFLLDPCLKL